MHRSKNGFTDWAEYMFDNQYMGAAYVAHDGHVLLHHFYTNSGADIKKTIFIGVLEMPRVWRIPLFTLRRFGVVHFGMPLKFINFLIEYYMGTSEDYIYQTRFKMTQFIVYRAILVSEFWFMLYTGHLTLFIL